MNKTELVASMAEKASLTKQQAAQALDAFIASISETLGQGGDVRLPGFGVFEVSHRAASKGRNPATGEAMDIPARNLPKFSAGKTLKEAVNK